MTGETDATLDRLTELFAAIGAAHEYGFSFGAAAAAASVRLEHLNRTQALVIASSLAALIATDLVPRSGVGLEWWAENWAFAVAMRGADG